MLRSEVMTDSLKNLPLLDLWKTEDIKSFFISPELYDIEQHSDILFLLYCIRK